MPIINTGQGLKGLNGLYDLDEASIQNFIKSQVEAGNGAYNYPIGYFDNLYRDQQFKNMFGEKDFNKYNFNQRNEMVRHKILLDEYDNRYNPYVTDNKGNIVLDENGKKKVDPLKGMGNESDYLTYRNMTSDGLQELLESDFLTQPERQKIIEDRKRQEKEALNKIAEEARKKQEERKNHGWFRRNIIDPFEAGGYAQAYSYTAQGQAAPGKAEVEEIADNHTDIENNHLLEKIYAKDLKKQEDYLKDNIVATKNEVNKLSESEVKDTFFKLITPTDDNIGNPTLYAHFTKDGNKRSDEVKDFSIEDMREYIARATTLQKYLGPKAAFDAMDFSSREYLAEHESNWEATKRHANEFGITLLNYGTSMIRGWENAAAMSDKNQYLAYQDNKGNVVETDKVQLDDSSGKYFITDDDGNKQIVHQVKMTKSELLQQGKDTDGKDKPWYLNNRFATDSQRFNTTDEAELERARKLGASSSNTIYAPDDEAGVMWQTAKMAAFPIMDIVAMIVPNGIGMAGKALGTTSKIGRVLGATAKVGRVGVALSSAVGIGHDYGTGVFNESLEANMQALEQHAYSIGQDRFYDSYNNDKQYKAQVDSQIATLTNELMSEDPELTKEAAKAQAESIVKERETQRMTEEYKNEDPNGEYSAGLQEATASATHAANVASVTDAMKYGAVNLFGYKSFLYKSPEDLAKSYMGRFYKAIGEEGGRAALKKAWSSRGAIGRAAVSQFWGGAWTNFTDEMQSEGGRAINADRFEAFMNNGYDGEGAIQAYSDINSYYAGALRALNKPHTWEAGLVGGLGSILNFTPNIGGMVEHLATSEGRERWRNMTTGEKMNAVLSNGILNNYYAQKTAYQTAENTVQLINKMLDNSKDFQALADALAVNTAETDATNENDANVMKYLKAVQTMQTLNDMANGKDGRDKIFDAIALKMTSVKDALNTIQKIADGQFNAEEAQEYVQSYYDKNPSLAKTEENDRVALDNVMANAKYLKEVGDKLAEVNRTIDKHEEILGTEFNPIVRDKIAQRMAVDDFFRRTYSSNEEAITGASANYSSGRPRSIQSYGSVSARSATLNNITDRMSRLQSNIDEAQNLVNEKREAVEQFKKAKEVKTEKDLTTLTRAEQDEYANLMTDYVNARMQLGYHQQVHSELSNTAEFLKEHEGATPQILTAAEILRLSPTDRARMLNKDNASNYSKNQLVEINKAREELMRKDPKLLQLIQDQANLARHIESNSRAYSAMLTSPEAALAQVQAMHTNSVRTAVANLTNRQIETLDKQVEYLLNGVDKETVRANLFNRALNRMSSSFLEAILDKDPSEIPSLSQFRAEVSRALDIAKTMENIQVAVNNMKLSQADATDLTNKIDQVLASNDAQTRAEILDTLQAMADEERVLNVPAEDRAKFQKLLQEIQNVEELDSSTRIISKELAKANNNATIREQAEQTKRTRQAEEEAKRRTEEERTRKATEERAKAQAIEMAKRQATAFVAPYSTGQYRTRVSRANDGTITTKFERYRSTSHGGRRKTDRGVPIDTDTIVGSENASSAELLTLKEKGGNYSGTVRVKEGTEWSTKDVKFSSNPIATPRSSRQRQAAPQQAPVQQAPAQEAQQPTPQAAPQAPQAPQQGTPQQGTPEAQTEAPTATPAEGQPAATEPAQTQEGEPQEGTPEENAPTAEQQAQAAHHNITAEDNNAPEAQLSNEDVAQGLEQGEIVDLIESPTLEEQVAAVPEEQAEVTIVPADQQEMTEEQLDELPTVTAEDAVPLLGNKFPGYDINALANEGREVLAKGEREGDQMNNILNWLRDAGINLQEIIDHELGKIIQMHPETKIHFLRVNPQNNATHDTHMQKSAMLAVEYTNEIARLHKDSRGGVVNANGKQYLIVGILGTESSNTAQSSHYTTLMDSIKQRAWGYFQHNQSERFWVDPNNYTGVFYISNGRIVRQALNDSEVQIRTIQELLYNEDGTINEERNPDGYQLNELQWCIQQENKRVLIRVPDETAASFIKDVPSNIGSVFLFAPTANGKLVPLFIRPTKLQELRPGALVDEIKGIITRLASPEHSERVAAVTQLSQRIVISADGMQILVGNESRPNITIQLNGTDVAHYELSARDFSVQDIVNAIFNLNPRVNVTAGVLSNATTLKMYDDAGALLTDAAKLGTSNAKVLVHPVGADGKPVITRPVDSRSNTDPANNSDLDIANRKLKQAETLNGTVYRKSEDGVWYTETGQRVTDPRLVQQIEYNNMIRANNMIPDYQGRSSNGAVTEYYIISSDRSNPKVLARVTSTKFVSMLSARDSLATLDFLRRKQEEEMRQAAVEEANRRAAEGGEDVDLTDNTQTQTRQTSQATQATETLTDEQLEAQAMGDFESTPQAQADAEADNLVDQVTSDIANTTSENRQTPQPAPAPQASSRSALDLSNAGQAYTAEEILRGDKKVRTIKALKNMGFKGKISDAVSFLQQKNMPITGITDVNAWIDMLESCR